VIGERLLCGDTINGSDSIKRGVTVLFVEDKSCNYGSEFLTVIFDQE